MPRSRRRALRLKSGAPALAAPEKPFPPKKEETSMASPSDPLTLPGAGAPPSTFEEATYRKVARRLTPLLLLCYVVAYLDRVNVGFAKLQMAADLNLSDAVYGLGAGIFFIGYFLFEVPSNLILHRVGARVWIARIMFTWGIISALTMF